MLKKVKGVIVHLYYMAECGFTIALNMFFTFLSLFIPKSKQYVIVGGWNGKRYADNSRAFYEYLTENKQELGIKKVFWYTKDQKIFEMLLKKNYDVLYGINMKSIFWHFRSRVHVIDQYPSDVIGFLSVRCIRINLFHGIALKKIYNYMRKKPVYVNFFTKLYSKGFWRDQYLLVTSEWSKEIESFAFGITGKKCLISSYPRNARLYAKKYNGKQQEPFKVIYLPTFRDDKKQNPLLETDIEGLNSELGKRGILLYVKSHFANKAVWNRLNGLENVVFLEAESDVYDILPETDLLITDYSSVFFDYIITGKPIIFFPYDYEYYKNSDRGFVVPYDEYTPGIKVETVDELLEAIYFVHLHYNEYIEEYMECYNVVSNKAHKYLDEPDYTELVRFWRK